MTKTTSVGMSQQVFRKYGKIMIIVFHSYDPLLKKLLLVWGIVAAILFCYNSEGKAHSPHDPIDVLALSPNYGHGDETVFIAISDQLLKSQNGGYTWKQIANGLDSDQLISSICISPLFNDDKSVFFSTEGNGIYRSEDRGDSWVKDNEGLGEYRIKSMQISPLGTPFAVDFHGKLWRKDRQWQTWEPVAEKYSNMTAICFASLSPEKTIMFLGDQDGVIYTSFNEGMDIRQIHALTDSGPITVIKTSPRYHLDQTVFVGTSQKGVFKSISGGTDFVASNNGMTDMSVVDLAVTLVENNRIGIYASNWNQAVFASKDGAATWQLLSKNLSTDKQADTKTYRSPHFRSVVLSSVFELDNTIFLGGFDGLFVSQTGGREWKQLETLPLKLVKGMGVFADRDATSLAVTTYGGGAYMSLDKGKSWAITNSGLVTTRLSDIRYSPAYARDNTLFSASMGYLLKSVDRGKKWKKISLKYNGVRRKIAAFLNTIMIKLKIPFSWTDLLLKKLEKTRPWPTVIAVSQDYEKDKTLFFGTRNHGVYRSIDGGGTHKKVWDATGRTISSLVISPGYSSDKTLFVSVRGLGVFKSMDEGNSWTEINNGFDFITKWLNDEVIHQIEKKDIKLMISPDFLRDRTLFARSSEGLYKTVDSGNTWRRIESPVFQASRNIIGADISPGYQTDKTLVVSVKGRGLYQTRDGGSSFTILSRNLIERNHNIEYIQFSPLFSTDNTIFVASDEEVFISTDSGKRWELLERPVRYENHRTDVLRYRGNWKEKKGKNYSSNSISISDIPGSSVELDFVGTGIKWVGTESNSQGKATVYIDGVERRLIVPIKGESRHQADLFAVKGLSFGVHQIRILVDENNGEEGHGVVTIDAFDVMP